MKFDWTFCAECGRRIYSWESNCYYCVNEE